MELFTALSGILQPGESLRFEIKPEKEGRITAIIIPELKDEEGAIPAEAAEFRAKLARPQSITALPEELDRDFPALMCRYAEARSALSQSYSDLLDAAKEAATKAAKVRAEQQAKATTKSKSRTAKKPGPKKGQAPKVQEGKTDAAAQEATSPTPKAASPAAQLDAAVESGNKTQFNLQL